ncbi:hypothetical protein ARC20_08515 [Stenotrophomonas panacihumi]|uniref:Uncharacterized protein n=1 Tax=Stenotrophomonas panacihumi TaxID=676599 RepID=A0A0R0AGS9_9GAMM|nr:hypothetical protein [Stenotrophomonas panacihumi]KRG44173.1 hypothetical protein ARC20_08515 [Stenotrophomonas panacihumi]PTN56268.1 hypothetical protein C9J98_00665 [Stenotrophomonas panacihumi]
MPQTRHRHLLILLAPAALLAAVWAYRMGGGKPVVASWPSIAPVAAVVTSEPRLPRLPPQTPAEARAQVAAGLPVNRRAAFEGETDLYRYAQQLAEAARGGDAEAGWMLSRVYDYCAAYAQNPAGYAADNTTLASHANPAVAAMIDARQHLQARCNGFVASDGLTAANILSQRTQAAQAGNLAAEAALLSLGQPLVASAAYKRDLVQRVLASRDPEAYLALSGAMGVSARGDEAYRGYVAGDQFAQLAWQLAACRLGLACGAESNLMTSYCANGGICSANAAQDFPDFVYDAAVPRQSADKMDEMINTLVNGTGVTS